MNEVSPELLDQLRDIHSAVEPGLWPPAPAWWVLAALVAGLLIWLLRLVGKRWVVRKRRARLLAALDHIQSQYDPAAPSGDYLSELNKLFRVVAMRAFPGTASARLQGTDWVDFMRSLLPDGANSESLAALESGPYRPSTQFDAIGLYALAREWVKRYG